MPLRSGGTDGPLPKGSTDGATLDASDGNGIGPATESWIARPWIARPWIARPWTVATFRPLPSCSTPTRE